MTPLMYRPDKKYLTKIYLEGLLIGLFFVATSGWLGYLIGQSEFGHSMGGIGFLVGVLLNLLWIIPTFALINRYYHSLHYEIHEDEVIMHVGVVTKTVKHVPFRTVTNIKVKQGPFDRLFSLGTIDIQTAGQSGESGAEESLVGLSNFREVYNQIASTLRGFRSAFSPTQSEEDKVLSESETLDKLLDELQQIRKLIEGTP
jgi:membrane protein YdbS with pleckstrin-like domain